jgi:hypothetical protein
MPLFGPWQRGLGKEVSAKRYHITSDTMYHTTSDTMYHITSDKSIRKEVSHNLGKEALAKRPWQRGIIRPIY